MSSPEQGGREWRFYVTDMIEYGERVLEFTDEMDQAAFVADRRTYDATLRNLELIGEAANNIPGLYTKRTRKFHGLRSSVRGTGSSMGISG